MQSTKDIEKQNKNKPNHMKLEGGQVGEMERVEEVNGGYRYDQIVMCICIFLNLKKLK